MPQVAKYLDLSKEQVIASRDSLKKIIELLKI